MKRKKLLFILLSSAFGGLELHTIEFCNWMQERGWDISLLCAKNTKVYEAAMKRNLKIFEIDKPRKYVDIKKIWQARIILNSIKPNIVFVSDNNDLNFAVMLKKFCNSGLKLIYILHMQIGVNKKDLYHRFIFSNVDKWVVPLEYLKKQTIDKTTIGENKIRVIKHGSEVSKLINNKLARIDSREILGIPKDSFILGMNARIDKQKNQHFIIDVLSKIIFEFNRKMFLFLLGKPTINEGKEYYDYIINLINEKNVKEFISLKDYLEDISIFYNAIDTLIVATEFETYGQNTIEAVISGIPVIGTNRGGTKELLQEIIPDLLYEPNNSNELLEKILHLENNYDYYKNKVLEARKLFSKIYSKENECESYEKLIEEL